MNPPPNPPDETQSQTPGVPEPRVPWYGSTGVLIAYSTFLAVLCCIIGFIPYWGTFRGNLQKTFQILSGQAGPAETPVILVSPTVPVADTAPTCAIVWVEYQQADLGKKSRATVWEQKVSDEVKDTGMTPREFYELVVEHNPQLIQDDYEFKKGKTYLLPVCQ
jgi:hypothetical protein